MPIATGVSCAIAKDTWEAGKPLSGWPFSLASAKWIVGALVPVMLVTVAVRVLAVATLSVRIGPVGPGADSFSRPYDALHEMEFH